MKTYREGEEQPVALYDDHGTLYVDNGNGTVTLADDQDGERETPWLVLETDTPLHSLACRRYGVVAVCTGDGDCARAERVALVWSDSVDILLAELSARS